MAPEKEQAIGLIIPSITNNFASYLLEQMEAQLEEHGFRLLISITNHSVLKEREMIQYFQKLTSGIMILSDASNYDELADCISSEVPIIFLNRKPQNCPHCCIISNDYSAVFQAIISSVNYNHQQIACVCSNPEFSTTKEILNAYQTAMQSTETGFHEDWIFYKDKDSFSVRNMVDEITAKGCNAIFAGSQGLTNLFLDYLIFYNRTATTKISLMGFSNEEITTFSQVSIDTIVQPLQQLTDLAVQQILYRIKNPDTPARDYLIKGTLRMRSVDAFHIDDI